MKTSVERRQYERFKTNNGTIVQFSSCAKTPGRLIDIGFGGLAFDYMGKKRKTDESMHLQLISSAFDPSSARLSVTTIWDVKIGGRHANTNTETRRCGVQFENVTEDQQTTLDRFIRSGTTAGMPKRKKGTVSR